MMELRAGLLAFVLAAGAWAEDAPSERWREVESNLASDWAQCSAYFLLVSKGFDNAGKTNESASWMSLAHRAAEMSADLSNERRAIAEVELAYNLMLEAIEGNLENIAVVSNDYLFTCRQLTQDPEGRVRYWIERLMSR